MHRSLLMILATLATICFLLQPPARADGPTYRSLRDGRPRQPDELDRPHRARRVSHRGWEVRSDHFVVVATTGPEQAQSVAQQLEATWRRFGRLADAWTDVHRQPNFAIGAVGVLIHDATVEPRSRPAPGPRTLNHGAYIYINLAPGEPSLDDQLPHVRGEAARAFLRVTGHDAVLPNWVLDGLAMYVAKRDFTVSLFRRGQSPAANTTRRVRSQRVDGLLPQRIAADRIDTLEPDGTDPRSVQFLLEADDARYAPALFAVLADSAQEVLSVRPGALRRVGSGKSTRGLENGAGWKSRFEITRLTGGADYRREFQRWQSQPLAGQPIFQPADIRDPQLLKHARRMALLLKLAHRFHPKPPGQRGAATGTPVNGALGPHEASVVSGHRLDLEGLYRRLTDPAAGPWATIDVDGTLLWSGNRARIDEIFRAPGVRYATRLRRGQSVLSARLETGEQLEAWLEPNNQNPARPIVRIQRVNRPPGVASLRT